MVINVFSKYQGVHGVVNSLDCGDVNNTYNDSGTEVTLTCNVQTASIAWTIQPAGTLITFNGAQDDTGDIKIINNIYNATYVDETPPATSTLAFVLNGSLNGTSVTCGDGGLPGGDMTCYILVIAPPILPSESLTIQSSTYESVLLQWSPPSFNGGSDITQYLITVSPLPSNGSSITCPGGQCNTTDVTFNVTGLSFNQEYTFTIRAENRAGIGNRIIVPFNVTGLVYEKLSSGPQLCLEYTSTDDLFLRISWNCDGISGNSNTPPLDNYTVCINANCQLIVTDNCSTSVPAEFNIMYTANVTLNNRVGPSDPSPSSNTSTDLLRDVRATYISNDSATISYSTFQGCKDFPDNVKVQLVLVNKNTSNTVIMDSKSYNRTDSFILALLNASTVYNYTLQVFVGTDINSGMKIGTSEIGRFMTSDMGDIGGDTVLSSSVFVSSSISIGPTMTPTGSTPSTTSPTVAPADFPLGAIIGIAVGVPILLIVLIVVIIVIYCVVRPKGKARDSDEPIALVDRSGAAPETGQALYQDPTTIEHQQAPSGDLYAMPEKGKGKGSRRQVPTTPSAGNATYQDPSTIERQQAPTGDLYAMPEKKPKYSEVNKQNANVVYTDVDVIKGNSGQPRGKVAEVVYSDLK